MDFDLEKGGKPLKSLITFLLFIKPDMHPREISVNGKSTIFGIKLIIWDMKVWLKFWYQSF